MKSLTAELLVKYGHEGKIEYKSFGDGLDVQYTLTDDELEAIVEAEYGATSQDKEKLFEAILKTALRLAVEHSKKQDKLSEL